MVNFTLFTEVITMWSKFTKDEKGFTGLEAAIVLVAFVVVAAVFSYVMLGAGFYTTQKSQEVVHTGVQQASSSVELSGDVLAKGASDNITDVTLFLQLTAGGSSVDMSKTLITYTDPDVGTKDLSADPDGTYASLPVATASRFGIVEIFNDNGKENLLIEKGEKFEVTVELDTIGASIGPYDEFQLEIKPPQGASYTIHRKAPASISDIMALN
jgi:flagellin FlaB